MDTMFFEVLVKLRREAGFPTAYGFYTANGGAPVLKITYRKYLLFEQGRELPAVEKLSRLFFALRLIPKSFQANELVVAWLRSLSGEEVFKNILQPVISEKAQASSLSPLHKAVKRALTGNKYQLTPGQFNAILTDRSTYLCYLALAEDTGLWSPENLAKALKLKTTDTATALKILAGARILKADRKGLYRCPFASGLIDFPHLSTVSPEVRAKLAAYHKELLATGTCSLMHGCVVRADAAEFRNFFPLMTLNVSTAQTYAVHEKTDKSALFFVESKVTKLRDF